MNEFRVHVENDPYAFGTHAQTHHTRMHCFIINLRACACLRSDVVQASVSMCVHKYVYVRTNSAVLRRCARFAKISAHCRRHRHGLRLRGDLTASAMDAKCERARAHFWFQRVNIIILVPVDDGTTAAARLRCEHFCVCMQVTVCVRRERHTEQATTEKSSYLNARGAPVQICVVCVNANRFA